MKNKKRALYIFTMLFSLLLVGCSNSSSSISCAEDSSSSSGEQKIRVLEKDNLTNTELIKWHGRSYYDMNEKRMYFYYTATGFEIYFYGTSLDITIHATNTISASKQPYFSVFLDGADLKEATVFSLSKATSNVTLANNLENGLHSIKVLKRSEPQDSVTSISSIRTDGYFTPFVDTNKLNFQIIGGSGISGHGSLGLPKEGRTTKNSSSLHAFGYLTARLFDANTQFISNSGCGLKWGFRNSNILDAYDKVGLDENVNLINVSWDHTKYVPDVVIINIGGNDFDSYVNTLENPTNAKKEFRDAVIQFLTHIHTLYPKAYVIWTHTGSANGSEAASAISDYKNRAKVKVVTIPKVASDGDPSGANGHNSVYTHIRTADIIASAITNLTKLLPVKNNIVWD